MNMDGERLRLRRKARGLTQGKLGAMVGCCGHCISNYEKRNVVPSGEIVGKIAEVLGEF